jgi:hypothetical protein
MPSPGLQQGDGVGEGEAGEFDSGVAHVLAAAAGDEDAAVAAYAQQRVEVVGFFCAVENEQGGAAVEGALGGGERVGANLFDATRAGDVVGGEEDGRLAVEAAEDDSTGEVVGGRLLVMSVLMASAARAVLPMPPGPTRVTLRPGCNSARRSLSSCSRPVK